VPNKNPASRKELACSKFPLPPATAAKANNDPV